MKFTVDMSRHDSKNVAVFAVDRDVAAQMARDANPGFSVDGVVQLGEGDAVVAEHTVLATCESCAATIWEGEDYSADLEGCYVCHRCMAAAQAEGVA